MHRRKEHLTLRPSLRDVHACLAAALVWATLFATPATATQIDEILEPPATPGNAYSGTFVITPSETIWAFGVAADGVQDTSISGVAEIDGLDAGDHWISSLVSRDAWDGGFDFDSIRPIGATPPSSFSIDTTAVPWRWGAASYTALYWLAEAGDDASPAAVLQPGERYDAFKFFTSGPGSPFAAFTAPDGGDIVTGETTVIIVPEPMGVALVAWAGLMTPARRRRLDAHAFASAIRRPSLR